MLEAASENASVLLLTFLYLVSSCPTSVVLVAEDVGGFVFFERDGKRKMMALQKH